jgi:hypothetical protein
MQLCEVIQGSLKTPWLACTHLRSIKRQTLIKFPICKAVLEIKENKNLTLNQLAVLILGICRILNKLVDFLKEEQMKILSNNFETPHKPRLSEAENSNHLLIQSSLRYSGENFKMLTGSHKKNEDFRQAMGARNILEELEIVSVSENRIFFGEDTYLEPSNQLIHFEEEQNYEFQTPKIDNRSNRSGFPTSVKSTVKKKKLFDDVTVIKGIKEIPSTRNIEKIRERIEIPTLAEEILKFLKDFKNKEEIQIDGVIDEGFQPNFLNFSGGFIENNHFDGDLDRKSEKGEEIIYSYKELAFESEVNPYFEYKSPVKNTQNLRFEEKISGIVDSNGNCWFSEAISGYDRIQAAKAFALLLVSANTKGVKIHQIYSQDIKISIMKDFPIQNPIFSKSHASGSQKSERSSKRPFSNPPN